MQSKDFLNEVERLEELVERRVRQGVVLLTPILLPPLIIILFSTSIADSLRLFLELIFVSSILIGLAYSLHWGRNGKRYLHSIGVLTLISPPYPTIDSKVGINDRSPIYVLALWGVSHLIFVRLLDPKESLLNKTILPRIRWWKNYDYQIDGVTIARKEGEFTIPKETEGYISGEGILYALPLERNFWVPQRNPISRDILLRIIRALTLDLAIKV